MADTDRSDKLLWLDLEMTGLDPEPCVILEVAAIVTDLDLKELGEYCAVVDQPDNKLAVMNDWVRKTHTASGLLDRIHEDGQPLSRVEDDLVSFVSEHFEPDEKVILCGNSIGQDRKFIDRYMPRFEERLHYRVVDVSSFKEIMGRKWGLNFKKAQRHRALDDIKESIDELRYYLSFFSPAK